ncbi:ROK family transcriptional regulator [Bifidobacterium saguinibicoloris]|uniref:ROK family transcriptional regulator n=1 Tax=Bifidobacterium saguinibicoloris TaxID=2834433 RepID=UPI001C55C5BD|nr:ROK family transcriptional regulator [Bifidobacterium saguinibicoloris]MBW3081028.1 ROK family transcriptional regulator [Bifidobacterium saguinibicoloris]
MKAMPPTAIGTTGRTTLTRYLIERREATRQDIERDLGMSLPTITRNLRSLEADGIVRNVAMRGSTGGRKAAAYGIDPNHRIAIGVTMRPNTVRVRAVNLNGEVIGSLDRTMSYRNQNTYYQRVGAIIGNLMDGIEQRYGRVLGVAFCVRGIVSPDGASIVFDDSGHAGPTLETIAQSVHRPCMLVGECDALAAAELWTDPTLDDAVCIYLDRRPGGALTVGGRLHQGENRCNGAIAHMTLVPDGRPCLCGRRGCMDAYCSLETLPEDYESIPGFFSVLEQGETNHRERMDAWLDHVAQAIANARTVVAGDVVVGGEAALYLEDTDLEDLRRRIVARSPFGTERFVLRRSRGTEDQSLVGAALRYVEPYLDDLCGGFRPRWTTAEPA